mgnify:CR=1 FL=1
MPGIDETDTGWRVRQRDPGDFEEGSFKTIDITDGVQAVVGRLKGEKSTTVQSLIFDKEKFKTEAEARKVKAERGIVPAPGNEDYLAAMLSTVSAIRDEISHRLEYWQEKVSALGAHEPVSRAILAGGNASVRGLPEYLEGALKIPVSAGDVFTNLASRDKWIPELDYTESLAYATAIGLALRDDTHGYV